MTPTEILTAVLVIITAYYAWQNRKMAAEMAATRKIAVLPKLAIDWTMVSPTVALPTITNVGPGPALDVAVAIEYVPLPGQENKRKVRQWTANLMAPGESKQFLPLEKDHSGSMQTKDLAETYAVVRLTGRLQDVLGNTYLADAALEDIAEWRKVSEEAIARWQDPDPIKRQAKEVAEELEKRFKPLFAQLGKSDLAS
jgi:predicted DNA-binding protein YlxM (UPF0122 family)